MNHKDALKHIYDIADCYEDSGDMLRYREWEAVHLALEAREQHTERLEELREFDKRVIFELAAELAFYYHQKQRGSKSYDMPKSVQDWINEMTDKVAKR